MDSTSLVVDLLVSLVSKSKPQALENIKPAFSPNLGEGYIDNSPDKLATQDKFDLDTLLDDLTVDPEPSKYKESVIEPVDFEAGSKVNILTSKNKDGDSHSFVLDLDCPHHFETDEQGNGYLVLDYEPTKAQLGALNAALKMMGLAEVK